MDRMRSTAQLVVLAHPPTSAEDGPPLPFEPTDLVSRAQRGDAAAFGALYEEYAPTIYRFLKRRQGGADELAEDLTAEVFVKAFQKLGQYQARGLPFSAWLYRIARNHLIDHLRSVPRHAACSLDRGTDGPDGPEVMEVADQTASRVFDRVLDQQVLGPALAQLTGLQRRAVELRFLEGRSIAETAVVMGSSEDAVKKLQMRGLINLRRVLAPASPSLPVAPAAVYAVA